MQSAIFEQLRSSASTKLAVVASFQNRRLVPDTTW
jgi:hypothetical protein